MTGSVNDFKFRRGREKLIRERLGCGHANSIGISDLTETAKVREYDLRHIKSGHWVFGSDEYSGISTARSKSGIPPPITW